MHCLLVSEGSDKKTNKFDLYFITARKMNNLCMLVYDHKNRTNTWALSCVKILFMENCSYV